MLDISIILCSRGRPNSVEQTLIALSGIKIPAGRSVELIVGDNNSEPELAAYRDLFAGGEFAAYCYIHERNPGKSRVLNRAVVVASGSVLVFLDDDVIPPRDWLDHLCSPIWDGRADVVLGGVRLSSAIDRPWMTSTHRNLLADTRDWDPKADHHLLGINSAVRREAVIQAGGFDEALGVGAMGAMEDTQLSISLRRHGCRFVNRLENVVEHRPDASRLARANWKRRAIVEGRSYAYMLRKYGGYRARSALADFTLGCIAVVAHNLLGLPSRFWGKRTPATAGEIAAWRDRAFAAQIIRMALFFG